MKYKLLGKSGIRVSELCLGTMTFGTDWGFGADKEESKKIFDYFVEAGGNFFDTAVIYTNGTSEKYLGEFIASERGNLVIATKYTLRESKKINHTGNHYKNMIESIDISLKRLKTDYIDLYYVHAWDFTTDPEQVMRTLEYLVQSGKVLSLGISDAPAWVTSRCNTIAEHRGWSPFSAYQVEHCLNERGAENEIFQATEFYDMLFHSFGPLGAGLLTGKYLNKTSKEPRRMVFSTSHRLSEKNLKISADLVKYAKETDYSATLLALRWAMQKFKKSSPIFGARSLIQCKENLKALDFTLSEEQMKKLDEIAFQPAGFPMDFLNMPRVQEILYSYQQSAIEF